MPRPEITGRSVVAGKLGKNKPLVVSVTKAGILLDWSHAKIYELIRAGELDSYVEGVRRKVTVASIERLIDRRLAATAGKYRLSSKVPPKPKKQVAPTEGQTAA